MPDTAEANAARWFARSRSGTFSEADRKALDAWLGESPDHAPRFEACEQAWASLEALRAEPAILAVRDDVRAMARPKRRHAMMSVAAAMAALVISASVFVRQDIPGAKTELAPRNESATSISTGVGQVSRMSLPDGSQVSLDADSVLAVNFSATRRQITLQKGRAFFHVAHEARPFIVGANRFSVQATGTQFIVDRVGSGEKVVMVEGHVIARANAAEPGRAPISLGAGKELVADPTGSWSVGDADIGSAKDWMAGRLSFHQTTVAEIVGEANRYSQQKIVLADTKLASQRVSAVLKAGDIDTLVASLVAVGVAKVSTRSAEGIVLATP